MFKYTVCFVKKENKILMLNREKTPIMWNGVGGKIEKGEMPDEAALREVFEETNIRVDEYFSKGTICWETSNGELDGIYVYLYEVHHVLTDEPHKKNTRRYLGLEIY
ncbi:NUDIX domain-containing protein [Bacillus sp. SA1-12]|uniref:NUDIX domain-containing protein n=1 Tax=Bacillus sp. SA1-12 TaxID=1455638 RepID=UPI000AEC357F|nr:NUDIX domain-containing protein [Bacillus sp. SA1-12]